MANNMSVSESNTKLTYLEFIGCAGKTVPNGHWKDENNHKKYMEYLSYKLGYTKTEQWYNISNKIICDNYGGGVLRRFNNSPYKLIKSVFPENEWLVWMFKCAPNGIWKNADIRKDYVLWLGKRLGFNNIEDWYGITVKVLRDNYGGGLLDHFNNSPYKIIEDVFPKHKWLVWLFKPAPRNVWKNADIRENYVLWLGKRLGFNNIEDWYGITVKVLRDNYGGGLLDHFNNSPYRLIKDVFPDYKWLVWMFKCAPHGIWKDKAIREDYVLWLGKRLGFNNKDDWYGISIKAIVNNYGCGLLDRFKYSPYKIIVDVFPKYKWVKSKFCNLKTEKKLVDYLHKNKERLNIECIKHGYRPSWADVRATDNTYYIYDIYIKLVNGVESIIEIDGPQHYMQVSNWTSPEATQIRDRRKEDLAVYNNHNLLRVNQEDVLSDKGDWEVSVDKFIKEVYESEGVLIIDDCAGGERYSEI